MSLLLNFVGIIIILAIMYAISNNRKAVDPKLVLRALGLQFVFAFIIIKFPLGVMVIEKISDIVSLVLSYGRNGLSFVFGSLVDPSAAAGFIFIVQALGNIIFIGALVSALYYIGALGFVIEKIGWAVGKAVGTSKVESFVSVANVFLGQTESPLLISKYISHMTRSEIMMILISGMGSMSVSIMGGYAALGIPVKHLVIGSAMVPFTSIVIGKILQPETEEQEQLDDVSVDNSAMSSNIIEAIANGAMDGMHMVIAIAASLVAIISLVALANGVLGNVGLTLEQIFAWVFSPLAYLMGLPNEHILFGGKLLGCKLILNEFVSYEMLGKVINTLDPRTALVLSISQAGFANIGSMGVCVAGIGSLCPLKKGVVSQLVFKAMLGGFCVSVLNAMIVGILMLF